MLTSKKIFYPVVFFLALLLVTGSSQVAALDRRAYQHGVRLLKDHDENLWAIWSSSPGNPPEGRKRLILEDGTECSYFTHDIFYSPVDPGNTEIRPRLLLGMPEAQEPVDVAISKEGPVAITFEDGSETDTNSCDGVIKQRYKIYSRFPDDSTELGSVRVNGGHSGHIASVGNNFVIVYAEGWVNDDGVDDSGTANDIYVETIGSDGNYRWHKPVARDKGWPRDWWPLVAGSSHHALLVWQRLVKDSSYANLMVTLYDPQTNELIKPITVLKENLQHYHFDVQYLSKINRFLIVGNYLGKTVASESVSIISPKLFAYLLDEKGSVISYWDSDKKCTHCGSYPAINLVREARPAILDDKVARILYPVKPNGIVSLEVSPNSVKLVNLFVQEHLWFSLGTDGIFLGRNKALFMNLTPVGAKLIELPVSP